MKKLYIFISLLLAAGVLCTPAEVRAEGNDESRIHLKVLGGLAYSTLSGQSGVFGPMAGGRFDIRVSSRPVYVGAGIEYMNKGFSHHSNHSFLLPFLGSYHIQVGELNVEPFAGTAISYGFDWKDWDCGLRLGCNLRSRRWDFTVGYDLGFHHYKFRYASGRNQSLFLSAGYNFNLDIN